MDQPTGLGTPLRPGQQEQLDRCPPEVRPALRKLYDRMFFASEAHQERSQLRVVILKLRQRLESDVDEAEATELREELLLNEEWVLQAEVRCLEIDKEVSSASAEYALRLREWRLRSVPPERREEALSILRQESLALDEARRANQKEMREALLSMQVGVTAEAHLTAVRPSSDAEGQRLQRMSNAAVESAARLDAMVVKYKERCDTIRAEHDRRINALVTSG